MANKVALVTGAQAGIGAACAKRLARDGIAIGVQSRIEQSRNRLGLSGWVYAPGVKKPVAGSPRGIIKPWSAPGGSQINAGTVVFPCAIDQHSIGGRHSDLPGRKIDRPRRSTDLDAHPLAGQV